MSLQINKENYYHIDNLWYDTFHSFQYRQSNIFVCLLKEEILWISGTLGLVHLALKELRYVIYS